MKSKQKKIIIFSTILAIIAIVFLIFYFQSDSFISKDEKSIDTSSVISYTVFDDNNNQKVYTQDDEKFNEINYILSSAEITHNKYDIYLYGENSERIVFKSKYKEKTYYSYCRDGKYVLILKDFCEGRSTTYLLDNHDYLIAELSKNEYNKIFNN